MRWDPRLSWIIFYSGCAAISIVVAQTWVARFITLLIITVPLTLLTVSKMRRHSDH